MTNSFFNQVTGFTLKQDMAEQNSEPNRVFEQETQSDNATLVTPRQIQTPIDTTPSHDSDMPPEARRALIYLSQQGVVLHSNKPQLFNNIVRYQATIRRHLSELYCSLIIDEHSGVTFVARADFVAENTQQLTGLDIDAKEQGELGELDDEDVTSLIQKRTLTVYDTILLLNLRKYYQERQNLGETEITVDIEKLESLMSPFLPLTDHGSKDKKKLNNRLDDFAKKHKLVVVKRGNDERYEITPMIRYVVNASLLQAMLEEYKALLGETTDSDDSSEIDAEKEVAVATPTEITQTQPNPQQDSLF